MGARIDLAKEVEFRDARWPGQSVPLSIREQVVQDAMAGG